MMRRNFAVTLMVGMALCACNRSEVPCASGRQPAIASIPPGDETSSTDSTSEGQDTTASKLWRIEEAMNACIGKEPSTAGWLQCYDDASHAHYRLLSKTSTHEDLDRLFTLLADPMEHMMAGGEALYARKVAGGTFAALAAARAVVLTRAKHRDRTGPWDTLIPDRASADWTTEIWRLKRKLSGSR